MSDSIGNRLRKARMASKQSIEDVARATKIQASRIADLEQDDYSNFPSIVYAKGFLTLYAKYLQLDISDYLREFAHGGGLGMEGYDYLSGETYGQDVAKRKPSSPLPALALLTAGFIAAVVLVGLVWFINASLKRLDTTDVQETTEITEAAEVTEVQTTETIDVTEAAKVAGIQAPKTVEPLPPVAATEDTPEVGVDGIPVARATSFDGTEPSPPDAAISGTEDEPIVRRAVPVAVATLASETVPKYEVEIRPLRRTWVRVLTDKVENPPAFEGWLNTEDPPLLLQGSTFSVILLDLGAVEVLKNGQKVPYESTAFTID